MSDKARSGGRGVLSNDSHSEGRELKRIAEEEGWTGRQRRRRRKRIATERSKRSAFFKDGHVLKRLFSALSIRAQTVDFGDSESIRPRVAAESRVVVPFWRRGLLGVLASMRGDHFCFCRLRRMVFLSMRVVADRQKQKFSLQLGSFLR